MSCLARSPDLRSASSQPGTYRAEHVHDRVQVIVRPLLRSEQLGDVSDPQLVRLCRQQLRLLEARVSELVTPLVGLGVLRQDPVHRPRRTQVHAFIEQLRVDLRWRPVDEPVLVQHRENRLPLDGRELACGLGTSTWHRISPTTTTSVVRRAWRPECHACRSDAELWTDRVYLRHQFVSLSSGVGSVTPQSSERFFWTSTRASASSARLRSLAISRSDSRSRFASGFFATGFGPRCFGARPCSSPRARSRATC